MFAPSKLMTTHGSNFNILKLTTHCSVSEGHTTVIIGTGYMGGDSGISSL